MRTVQRANGTFVEYEGDLYPIRLTQGNAMENIESKALEFCRGRGIDIGANKWPLAGATPIDLDGSMNAYDLHEFEEESLDFVFASHVLEHLEDWEFALRLWISKLKIGGILFLYLPHESMKLWRMGSPYVTTHKWIPTWQVITEYLVKLEMKVLDFNPDKDDFWSFHIISCKA